jgi:hypothetical protein
MKLTESHKTLLDEATSLRFMRRAAQAGCATSELLRDMVCELEWGKTWGEHVAESRRAALNREAPIQDSEKPESWIDSARSLRSVKDAP